MPDDLFLFEELDDLADALPDTPTVVYTSPIEQATFDIMELVDGYFRAAVTVEEYDTMQKNVKKILSEAFDDREKTASHRALISRPDD